MLKTFTAILSGAMVFASASGLFAADAFKPVLQKATVNGETLYQAGATTGKTIEADSSAPLKIEYVFVNKGDAPAGVDAMVFVHFDDEGEIAVGGDYKPATPTSKWEKDKPVVDVKTVDLSKLKGKTTGVFVGLYNEAERLDLANEGFGEDQRLSIGSIKVK